MLYGEPALKYLNAFYFFPVQPFQIVSQHYKMMKLLPMRIYQKAQNSQESTSAIKEIYSFFNGL